MEYDNKIADYWLENYCINGLCSLCGQSGIIHTEGVRTPAGHKIGRANYCICPNGQLMRKNKTPILSEEFSGEISYLTDTGYF